MVDCFLACSEPSLSGCIDSCDGGHFNVLFADLTACLTVFCASSCE
jgi:hypothetical protein